VREILSSFCADEFATKPLSVWVVADLGTTHGREVARNALTFAVSVHQKHIRSATCNYTTLNVLFWHSHVLTWVQGANNHVVNLLADA